MKTIRTVEDVYQMALKAEEKLSRKLGQQGQGRGQPKGKLVSQDRFQKSKDDWKKPQTRMEIGGSSQRGQHAEQRRKQTEQSRGYADNNTFPCTRGRGRGRGGVITCFTLERMDTR